MKIRTEGGLQKGNSNGKKHRNENFHIDSSRNRERNKGERIPITAQWCLPMKLNETRRGREMQHRVSGSAQGEGPEDNEGLGYSFGSRAAQLAGRRRGKRVDGPARDYSWSSVV